MKVAATKRENSEARLLDQGTSQLLRVVKQKMIKTLGRVAYRKLRTDGYSNRILARLEKA